MHLSQFLHLSAVPLHFIPLTLALSLPTLTNPSLILNQSTPHLTFPDTPFCIPLDPACARPRQSDCLHIITVLQSDPSLSRQMREFITRAPEVPVQWKVPSTFVSGSCRITIGIVKDSMLEWSSLAEIAEVVQEPVVGCLGGSAGMAGLGGGFTVAGLGECLGVLVHGKVVGVGEGGSGNGTVGGAGVDVARRAEVEVPGSDWCKRADEGDIYQFPPSGASDNGTLEGVVAGGRREVETVDTDKVKRGTWW